MIRWEVRDRVGVATIDRPERRNALNAELCTQLLAHLESAPDLRAVVITGAGDKAFCAGADLAVRAADTADSGAGDTFRPAFDRLLDAIVDYPAPVLAAVNGPAIGAGMQLAVACDLRVAAFGATFSIPAARLGVFLSPPNVQRLAALVGQGPARDLLLAARTLDVDEAAAVGLVQRRVPDALDGALELAEEIAELAPLTVQGHKRALNVVAGAVDASALDEMRELEDRAFASDDLQEGLAAFAEKRPPRFEGR
ncbi:MAG TPA: enoyl-CoA hydratase-related protein [Acidimicrobiia bacterium]|nr:enoyl-CoA hydratase-related protein [Acidimicrobiia bacterium]